MTALPQLSVIMPSFNYIKYIRAAIDSVLSQREGTVELIVMDGGSTDGTIDILRRYGDRLSFIHERDRGQADAINRGLQRARADILCWLNSDDMFTPGALGRVLRVFRENLSAEFVYGRGWNVDEAGRIIEDAGVLAFDLWRLIHQRNFIQQPSCFFRRSLLEKVGPLDEGLHYVMDWDLWIRFAAYRGLYVDDFWSYNRVHHDNKTQSGQLRRWNEIRTMIRRYTDARRPPVVRLYLLEALIQLMRSRGLPPHLDRPLAREFERGMRRHPSGRYPDGSVRPRFRFSVGNVRRDRDLVLTFSPLSRYHPSRLGAAPIAVRWRSSSGGQGRFTLLENGAPQRFPITVGESASTFAHITCWSDDPGTALGRPGSVPTHRIIGFLDDIDPDPAPSRAAQEAPISVATASPDSGTREPMAPRPRARSSPAGDSGSGFSPRCWCGAALGPALGDHYRLCPVCGTAARVIPPGEEPAPEAGDCTRQRSWVVASPSDVAASVFTDVARRCLHGLDGLLEFVIPPGRVLEIGCGHGGFVRLLREAGFEATGTELSPWVADFARAMFGVQVELGSIETLALEPSFLAVCAFHLLEHTRDPVRVSRRAAELLRPDGVLRLQAACYRGQGPGWAMFQERNHVFLFSKRAIRRLLGEAGFRDIAIEPGPLLDEMWVTAARAALPRPRSDPGSASAVPAWTRGLHALRTELARAEEQRADAEADGIARLGHLETLSDQLRAAETERAAWITQIETLTGWLRQAEADRDARLAQIETLTGWLHQAEADRDARLAQIETLTGWLHQAEADRAARFTQIETLTASLRQAHSDGEALRARIEAIHRTRIWRVYRFAIGRRNSKA